MIKLKHGQRLHGCNRLCAISQILNVIMHKAAYPERRRKLNLVSGIPTVLFLYACRVLLPPAILEDRAPEAPFVNTTRNLQQTTHIFSICHTL